MEQCIAFGIMAVLIGTGIYFLHKGKLGGPSFTAFTIGLLILFIGFYSIDRLKEIDIAGARLVLQDMKETKSDFDKEVAVLSETLSELIIDYTLRQGFISSGPSLEEMVKASEIAKKLLSLTKKTDKEIDRELSKIDGRVLTAYISRVIINALEHSVTLKKLSEQDRKSVEHSLYKSRKESSSKSGQIDDFEELLKKLNIEEDIYKESIKDMRYYLKEKKLRRPDKQ